MKYGKCPFNVPVTGCGYFDSYINCKRPEPEPNASRGYKIFLANVMLPVQIRWARGESNVTVESFLPIG